MDLTIGAGDTLGTGKKNIADLTVGIGDALGTDYFFLREEPQACGGFGDRPPPALWPAH